MRFVSSSVLNGASDETFAVQCTGSIYLGISAIAGAYFNSLVMCIQGDQGAAGVPGDIGFQGDKVIVRLFSIIFSPLT